MTEKLAIDGGEPAIAEGPPTWPLADDAVQSAMMAAYASGDWGRYHGRYCVELAERLCQYHAVDSALLCCSGTVAVEIALRGVGVGEGDEVVLAGYDFPGNFRAVEATGARPVLVDIDSASWCLGPEQIEAALTADVRAVIVSHLHGGMAPMRQIMQLASDRGVAVVEDACQSPGARIDDRVAGSWGDVGVLSFGGSKLLTAGRGGAIVTSKTDVFQRAKIFCERGNHAFPLSELQAAVLLPQLERLDARNVTRRENVMRLLEAIKDISQLTPVVTTDSSQPSYYKLAFHFHGDAAVDRQTWIAAAQAEGVAIDAGFRGFARRSERRCRRVGDLINSQQAAEDTLLLHHPVLLSPPAAIDRLAYAAGKIAQGLAVNR